MTVKLRVELIWIDKYTKFVNLKEDENMNTLTDHQKDKLWIPTLFFINAAENNVGYFDDDLSNGKMDILDKNINATFADLFEVKNNMIHRGEEV